MKYKIGNIIKINFSWIKSLDIITDINDTYTFFKSVSMSYVRENELIESTFSIYNTILNE